MARKAVPGPLTQTRPSPAATQTDLPRGTANRLPVESLTSISPSTVSKT